MDAGLLLDIEVRPARAEDWPAVARLLAELGRPDVGDAPDDTAHRDAFSAYIERADTAAFVALVDGSVVGFIDMEFRQRLNFLSPQAWIPDVIVAETHRGSGVGKALLSRAEDAARERGCWGMTLESATWRTRAHAFYEREGWAETGKAFNKNLGDVAWPPAPRR